MRDKVYEIIDKYFKKFTQEGPDTENWRFRLLRTDLRNYKALEDKESNYIQLVSATELEPDLKEKSEIVQKELAEKEGFMKLFLWTEKEFVGESTGTQYYQDCQDVLSSIKKNVEILNKPNRKEDLKCYFDGIIKGAAVLIRDHADNLDKSDLSLCIEMLINTIADNMSSTDQVFVRTFSKASTVVTQMLPIILDYVKKKEKVYIRELIVTALTHNNEDFCKNIAIGIQKHLWQREPDFAQRCFDGAFEFARLRKTQWDQRSPIFDKDSSKSDRPLIKLRKKIIILTIIGFFIEAISSGILKR
jgi:hypothetical protein